MRKSETRLLGLILMVSFGFRLIFGLFQSTNAAGIDRLPDQREYLELARNLLNHGKLCFVDPRFDQTVYAYRLPGYPMFLAACSGSIRVARVAQALLDTSTLIAVFLIARRASGCIKLALIATGLMGVNPFYVYFSSLLLSETLFAALIAWALYFLIVDRWVIAVVLLASACLVRPTGALFLPLVLCLVSNRAPGGAYRLWDRPLRLVIAILVMIIFLFPWAWRNHNLLDRWIWTTTNGGITLYDGFNPQATGESNQRILTDQPFPASINSKSINELQRSQIYQHRAWEWISGNWKALPGLSVRKIARGWSPVPLSREFGRPMYRFISAGYSLPFDLLCLIGFFSARLSRPVKLLLIAPAVIVTLQQVMSVGSIRYRMPAEAPLAVVVAAGAMDVVSRVKARTGKGNANIEH